MHKEYFGLNSEKHKVISVVGAGGKTSLILGLMESLSECGLKVLYTTSTHIYEYAGSITTGSVSDIEKCLSENGKCIAGTREAGTGKLVSLDPEIYAQACMVADIVFVEADGAKHMSLKWPKDTEPVYPANTDAVIVVMGMDDIGRSAKDCIFRFELAKTAIGINDDQPVTEELILEIVHKAYVEPLLRMNKDMPVRVVFADRKQDDREFRLVESFGD